MQIKKKNKQILNWFSTNMTQMKSYDNFFSNEIKNINLPLTSSMAVFSINSP